MFESVLLCLLMGHGYNFAAFQFVSGDKIALVANQESTILRYFLFTCFTQIIISLFNALFVIKVVNANARITVFEVGPCQSSELLLACRVPNLQ